MSQSKPPDVLAVRSAGTRLGDVRHPIEPSPPFPLDVFPSDVRAYIAAGADSARVPAAMVALPFLCFAGATIGNQLCFVVGNGWAEYPGLWTAVIAMTGAGKTPALAWARLPVDHLQREAWAGWKGRRPLPRLIANDFAFGPIAEALVSNPGLAIVRDELYGLLNVMSQFTVARSRSGQSWLTLWSSDPLSVSNGRQRPTHVWNPVVGICGGIQPQLWCNFAKRQLDGTLERFIPVVFGLPREYWNESLVLDAREPDTMSMVSRFRRLRTIAPDGLTVTRSPAAGLVWAEWFNDNLDRTLAAPMIHFGYYQKLPSQVARTALILHALWHPDDPSIELSADTMRHATDLGEFYRVHIHRSLALLGHPGVLEAPRPTLGERLLRRLGEHTDNEGWMTRSELHAALGKPERSVLQDVIDSLVEARFIDRRKQRLPHSKRPIESLRLSRRDP